MYADGGYSGTRSVFRVSGRQENVVYGKWLIQELDEYCDICEDTVEVLFCFIFFLFVYFRKVYTYFRNLRYVIMIVCVYVGWGGDTFRILSSLLNSTFLYRTLNVSYDFLILAIFGNFRVKFGKQSYTKVFLDFGREPSQFRQFHFSASEGLLSYKPISY